MVRVEDRPTCFYCTKCGHIISNCFVIVKNNCPKAVTLLKREASNGGAPHTISPMFSPLIMKGSVSLTDERPEVPVVILRDSGGLAVTHVRRSVAFIRSSLNSDFLLWVWMQFVRLPLHKIFLDSELVKRPFKVDNVKYSHRCKMRTVHIPVGSLC